MINVSTNGLDIAKSAFQVHGIDVAGSIVIRKRASRAKVLEYFGRLPRCLIIGAASCRHLAIRSR
jgi:transposase